MSSHSLLAKVKVNNASVGRQLEGIIRSIEGMQVQNGQHAGRSDLLTLEVGNELKKEFQLIHSLLNSNAVGEVFLTSTKVDPSVLLQAIKAGTRHFFSQPLDESDIRDAWCSTAHNLCVKMLPSAWSSLPSSASRSF